MFLSEFFSVLDSRSFSSPWFWLVFIGLWAMSGRAVLGVPNDVLSNARRALSEAQGRDGAADLLLLLDWLSLHVPRWRIARMTGAILTGLIAFALTVLAVLGFYFGLEMAQAVTLLACPFALLLGLKMRLAHQLYWVVEAAHLGQSPRDAGAEAMKHINHYRILHMLISLLAVTVTAMYASLWLLLHPNGL
ncbi:hypothetical protein [Paracoccus aerodenitrificans]|uniref:hypothetical protein n=1 Tax=Paracoccus aerodenitrificans TaxID=3017781 RepID=UPI0022F14355|nr:hypothetical protein [Paracoccus aerodenitrificans]WBU62646.1 hypothetical protein PAE61_09660 [Paracoccus aerodenitrificans]